MSDEPPKFTTVQDLPEPQQSAVQAYLDGVRNHRALVAVAIGYDERGILRVTSQLKPNFRLKDVEPTVKMESVANALLGDVSPLPVRFDTCLATDHKTTCGCARFADKVIEVATDAVRVGG
jgi:hypothetical protein